ncbi:hypothetical protein QFC22_000793 [Naganishia vaughanmartiniae]|uniref:Uncharacterized protein n=1 Tax=Naganishia vaughanmartiniae TaxID=1424756 RepID=A0ACC2XLU7_9TREE|nr:hypothetical protein QFC22_000793 [Naganishia vaughanmartiniae]
MCCQANWKREAIPDHKFDFVDTAEFHTSSWFTRLRYVFIYIFMLKNLAIYCLDIYTAITMVASSTWTNVIFKKCGDDCKIKIPFHIAKWIFVGCIIFGFLLLAYEAWKARRVIKSRDIAFAYTNVMANDYYSLLVCYIQGNLKEFCCHKVDKRIAELLRHKQRARVRQQLALEKKLGEDGVVKDKTGKVIAAVALPTLPTLDFTENDEDMRMAPQRVGRRKSISRFARSLSRKVRKPPAPRGINAAAAEAGVGLPPVQCESCLICKGMD